MNKNSFIKPFIIFLTILIYTNNIVAHTIVLQNITSTAIQSTINGDSFTEALKHQAINTIVMAGANYAANQIGNLSHGKLDIDNDGNIIYTEPQINKATQLLLHAGLGAATNTLTGNDALSGAISGVVGEITADIIFNNLNEKYANDDDNNNGILTQQQFDSNKNTAIEYGGLAAGISSLIAGKVQDLDVSDIRDNVYAGYRVGKNAGENNATLGIQIGDNLSNLMDIYGQQEVLKAIYTSIAGAGATAVAAAGTVAVSTGVATASLAAGYYLGKLAINYANDLILDYDNDSIRINESKDSVVVNGEGKNNISTITTTPDNEKLPNIESFPLNHYLYSLDKTDIFHQLNLIFPVLFLSNLCLFLLYIPQSLFLHLQIFLHYKKSYLINLHPKKLYQILEYLLYFQYLLILAVPIH